eukprot:1160080-Pelagomonas_calceolata.AAC.16
MASRRGAALLKAANGACMERCRIMETHAVPRRVFAVLLAVLRCGKSHSQYVYCKQAYVCAQTKGGGMESVPERCPCPGMLMGCGTSSAHSNTSKACMALPLPKGVVACPRRRQGIDSSSCQLRLQARISSSHGEYVLACVLQLDEVGRAPDERGGEESAAEQQQLQQQQQQQPKQQDPIEGTRVKVEEQDGEEHVVEQGGEGAEDPQEGQATELPKKKRGRPPKKSTENGVAPSSGVGKAQDGPQQAKRRGRPPGKKNANSTPGGGEESKKRRGRPPKSVGGVAKPAAKKRGRPAKKQGRAEDEDDDEDRAFSASSDSSGDEGEVETDEGEDKPKCAPLWVSSARKRKKGGAASGLSGVAGATSTGKRKGGQAEGDDGDDEEEKSEEEEEEEEEGRQGGEKREEQEEGRQREEGKQDGGQQMGALQLPTRRAGRPSRKPSKQVAKEGSSSEREEQQGRPKRRRVAARRHFHMEICKG